MRIVIDARMYGLEHAGIGRYVMNLVNQIEKLSAKGAGQGSVRRWRRPASAGDKKNEYFVLLRKKYYRDLKFKNEKFKKILADYPHYSLKEQVFLPIQLFKLHPDLIHFPHFNVPLFWWGKQVVTIHDLIKHRWRGFETTTRRPLFYWFKYLNYHFLVWVAVKRAVKVLTPSQWWKKKLIKKYGLPANRVVVTYEGVGKEFKVQSASRRTSFKKEVLEKYKIKKPFVIYTGSLYPHKNVERLVAAVKYLNDLFQERRKGRSATADDHEADTNSLPEAYKAKQTCLPARQGTTGSARGFLYHLSLSLVVVCARNIFYKRFQKKINQIGAEKLVKLIGFVPDEELTGLYQEAVAFVFPSLLEGFGLPGLEAMAVGLPVLASSASCLPEVYGQAALYFDPLDAQDIAEKIALIMKDKKLREKLVKAGFQRVKKFSWEKMARATLKVYQEAT